MDDETGFQGRIVINESEGTPVTLIVTLTYIYLLCERLFFINKFI